MNLPSIGIPTEPAPLREGGIIGIYRLILIYPLKNFKNDFL